MIQGYLIITVLAVRESALSRSNPRFRIQVPTITKYDSDALPIYHSVRQTKPWLGNRSYRPHSTAALPPLRLQVKDSSALRRVCEFWIVKSTSCWRKQKGSRRALLC